MAESLRVEKWAEKNGGGRGRGTGRRQIPGLHFHNEKLRGGSIMLTIGLKNVSTELVSHGVYICWSSVRRWGVQRRVRAEMTKTFLLVSLIENSLSTLLIFSRQGQIPLVAYIRNALSFYL